MYTSTRARHPIDVCIVRVSGTDGSYDVVELSDESGSRYIGVCFQKCYEPTTDDFLVVPMPSHAIEHLYQDQRAMHDLVVHAIAEDAVYILEVPDHQYVRDSRYQLRHVDASQESTELNIQLEWFLISDVMLRNGPFMRSL